MSLESQKFEFDDFLLDPKEKILLRGAEPVSITPKAFDLLLYLVTNHGHLVEKNELINAVWAESFVEEANLPFTIGLLRKALGDDAQKPQFIETIPKRGYRFIAKVRTAPAHDSYVASAASRPYVLFTTAGIIVITLFAAAFIWFGGERINSASRSDDHLTTNGKVTVAAISPDGQTLVFAQKQEGGEGLWRREVLSGEQTQIIPAQAVEFVGLSVSPDNAYAYYSVFADNEVLLTLRRVPLDGGTPEPLTEIASDVSVSFSPDGKKFAYTESHSSRNETILKTANADGTDVRTLLTLKGGDRIFPVFRASPVSWSPDGRDIACAIQETDAAGTFFKILLVDPEDGGERYLSEQHWNFVEHIAWKDDGSLAIVNFELEKMGTQVWLIARDTGESRRLDRGRVLYQWLSAANGKLFAVGGSSHSSIYIADFPDGYTRPQTKQILDETGDIGSLAWPVNDKVFYNSWASGKNEIWRLNPDGTSPEQLTNESKLTQGFTVSPRNGRLVFAALASGSSSLFVADADGANARQLTKGVFDIFPRFLNDGKHVVYQEGSLSKSMLWRVSIEDEAPPQQVTGYFASQPSISPDGSAIAYQFMDFSGDEKRWRMAIMDVGSGRLLKKIDFPFAITERKMVWHPVENFLTMIYSQGDSSAFLFMSPTGNSFQTVENVASGKVLAFAWSPDGNRLAFAAKQVSTDVVVLDKF
jgi:DNA-binding winged helix-turn-helix (wHTH) protein/Tol biopolymer transport system component